MLPKQVREGAAWGEGGWGGFKVIESQLGAVGFVKMHVQQHMDAVFVPGIAIVKNN